MGQGVTGELACIQGPGGSARGPVVPGDAVPGGHRFVPSGGNAADPVGPTG
jgi:hypothetical protein